MYVGRRMLSIVLSFLFIASYTLIGQVKVKAVADVTPPVFNSLILDKQSVSVGDTINFTINATDDMSGIGSVYITYRTPVTNKVVLENLYLSNGVYVGSKTISNNDESGTWKIEEIVLSDNSNNNMQVWNTANGYGGTDNSVKKYLDLSYGNFVINGTSPDVTPPVFNSLILDKQSVSVGDTINFTINATDDMSGIGSVYITYRTPVTNKVVLENLYLSNGVYVGSKTISNNDESGTWKIEEIVLSDNSNNNMQVWNTANGYGGTDNSVKKYLDLSYGNFVINQISNKYTVTYDSNGSTSGSVPVDNSTYLQGATVKIPGNTGSLVKTGYTFAGWNTAADGSGTGYAAGATFAAGTANVTLYAKWTDTAASKAIGDFVTRLYQQCLNRDPDSGGLNYWKNQLASKVNTGADLSYSFIFSPEFTARNVSDDVFLNIMYNTFFNRAGDSGGKTYWMNTLANGMSRLYVLSCFVNSDEFNVVCNNYGINRGSIQLTKPADLNPAVTAFTYRFYVKCMGRTPDDSGLNYWVNQLVTGQSTGADISQGFVFSPEFTAKNLSNTDFTTVMYRVFFNREPDSGGQAYWVNALQSGTSRLDVLKGFVNSQEFAKICSDYGIKVGTVK